jgi:hypothetical protein
LRYVRFSGALTLTHNATSLILRTGANRTTASGDTALFLSDGSGNWREMSYSPATTGTGNCVLATSPTITTPTISGALTYGGVTLASAVTGTGNMVCSASPTFSGTVTGPDSGTWTSSGITGLASLRVFTGGTATSQSRYIQVSGSSGAGSSMGIQILSNGSLVSQFYYDVGTDATVIASHSKDPAITIAATTGNLRFLAYGAGTLVTDGSGNVTASSDETLKDIVGSFGRGTSDIIKNRHMPMALE